MSDSAFILRVLSVFSRNEIHENLWWRTDDEYAPVTFFVNCNDLFEWACADCENVESQADLDAIEQAVKDCEAVCPVVGAVYATSLWACRKRKQCPQRPAYPKAHPELWPLFDAAKEQG